MNPRALAAWTAAGLTIALSTTNPVYRALVVLCALNLILARGRPGARLRPMLIAVAVAALVSTVVSVLLSHTGSHALLRIPDSVPLLGGPLTLESIVYGLSTGLGIAAAVLSVAPLTLVTEPHELLDALPRSLARTGAAIGTALNLMPAMARSASEIRDAQRMRGWRARRVTGWPDIAVPVVLTAVESSLTLAEAMESRAYGAGPRTHFASARWTGFDTFVAAVSLAAAAGFVLLRVAGAVGDWYPFPTITAPAVDVAALLCCAGLALPALRVRR